MGRRVLGGVAREGVLRRIDKERTGEKEVGVRVYSRRRVAAHRAMQLFGFEVFMPAGMKNAGAG